MNVMTTKGDLSFFYKNILGINLDIHIKISI